jgi:DNA-binding XRE family transcriptional regulator
MDKVEIGRIMQKRREKLDLKQEDVAEMTGITSKTIYLIETGKGNSSIDTLTKLTEVLGLEINVDIKKIET